MNAILLTLLMALAVAALMYWRRIGALATQLRLLAHNMRKEFH